jgi:hypothetical protein
MAALVLFTGKGVMRIYISDLKDHVGQTIELVHQEK